MGATIRKYCQFRKILIHMRDAYTVLVYQSLENGLTGYEQLAGSRYTYTKGAESIMCTKIDSQQLLESFDTL